MEHRLNEEEQVCPQCGKVMREIGTEVRETLKLIPAKAIFSRDVYYTYFRRAFGVGGFCLRRTQVRAGQSITLPQGAMALSSLISGGRTAGAEQQPGRAQHQAFCDWSQEFPVRQHPARCPGQLDDLQPN